MKDTTKDKAVFEQMKKTFRECGLPISMENFKGRLNFSTGVIPFESLFDHTIVVGYAPAAQYIQIMSALAPLPIPKKKIQDLLVMINALNESKFGVTAFFYGKLKTLELKTGMYALKSRFNRNEFRERVQHLMEVAILSYPLLIEFIRGTIDRDLALKSIR